MDLDSFVELFKESAAELFKTCFFGLVFNIFPILLTCPIRLTNEFTSFSSHMTKVIEENISCGTLDGTSHLSS